LKKRFSAPKGLDSDIVSPRLITNLSTMDAYHVRFSKEEDPKGPYDRDALHSLATTGRLTPDSLIFDPHSQKWHPVASLPELNKTLFQRKKGLTLRQTVTAESLSTEEPTPSIKELLSDHLLHPDQSRILEEKKRRERLQSLSIPILCGLMALSAITLTAAPLADVLRRLVLTQRFDHGPLLAPEPLLGFIDAALAALLFLQAVPGRWILLTRATLGTAILASLHWMTLQTGQPQPLLHMLSDLAFGAGILLLSLTTQTRLFVAGLCLAAAGLALPLLKTGLLLWKILF
jgi:hypothetical protein